jgi:hypothetical protein
LEMTGIREVVSQVRSGAGKERTCNLHFQ